MLGLEPLALGATTLTLLVGTPALTSRGMGEAEMQQVGEWMARILRDVKDTAEQAKVREEVLALTAKFRARGVPVR